MLESPWLIAALWIGLALLASLISIRTAISVALIEIIIDVNAADAFAGARDLAQKEGLFVGASSGAALFMAQQYARKIKKGTIVTLFPDRGEKYLSTEMFSV